MVFEQCIRSAGLAVGLMVFEQCIRFGHPDLAVERSSSSSPTPARVIGGLVLETTGCLATLEFRFQVDIVVELGDAVTIQEIKELASRHARDLRSLAG